MPSSLYSAAARFHKVGFDVNVVDLNLNPLKITAETIGIGLIGSPYVPVAIKLIRRIKKISVKSIIMLGGQGISGLTDEQFHILFGAATVNGNNDEEVGRHLGFNPNELPKPHLTSMIPVYRKICDINMKEYLSREFCLYVSQGCKYACTYCGASKKQKEVYRDFDIIESDLSYLIFRAKKIGLKELRIYMSNLDVFQNTKELSQFIMIIKSLLRKNDGFKINLRGLSTVDSFYNSMKNNSEVIRDLVNVGFHSVGFGVDGWNENTWKRIKKFGNTEDKCLEVIRASREDFGLKPEIFMILGYNNADTDNTLKAVLKITEEMVERYGAIPKPLILREFIPGNDGWYDPVNKKAVNHLLAHPESFKHLDFISYASKLTHPDKDLREKVNNYYKM